MSEFLEELTTVVKPMAIGILPLGFHPFATPDEVALVPKQHYHIMDAYMPQVGTTGRHMMKLTCSTQVTIDFHAEADAMRKMQLAAKLTPFFVTLSANSVVQERRYGKLRVDAGPRLGWHGPGENRVSGFSRRIGRRLPSLSWTPRPVTASSLFCINRHVSMAHPLGCGRWPWRLTCAMRRG